MTKQSIEQRIDKVRGSMLGGAIGDALGYQIEFERDIVPRSTTRFTDGIGVISDDTQMTLFTACGLLWRYIWHIWIGLIRNKKLAKSSTRQ